MIKSAEQNVRIQLVSHRVRAKVHYPAPAANDCASRLGKMLPAEACWTRVAWLVRVILRRGRKHALYATCNFFAIFRETPLESLDNRGGVWCKTASYIITPAARFCTTTCNGKARNEMRLAHCTRRIAFRRLYARGYYRSLFISPSAHYS